MVPGREKVSNGEVSSVSDEELAGLGRLASAGK